MLHGYNPNTMQLPRLFAVDQVLGWENGQSFELAQMIKILPNIYKINHHLHPVVAVAVAVVAEAVTN